MYEEIKEAMNKLIKERSNCIKLSSAIGDICSDLSDIKYSLNLAASTLSLGALNIDGKAIDVYSFGGFKNYASGKVEPLISALGGISSQITTLITEYNTAINTLNERLNELANSENNGKKINDDSNGLKQELRAIRKGMQIK